MKQNKNLLQTVKRADKEINKFYKYMWDKYPDLELGHCGCLEYNNWTLQTGDRVCEEIHPRRLKKAKEFRL